MTNATESRSSVLVIDDDAELSELLRIRLERDGFRVAGVIAVAEIEKACADAPPAAIVMDLNLGAQDGLQGAEILARQRYQGPLFLISGSDERVLTAARRHAEGLGLNLPAVFRKPFSIADLSVAITVALAASRHVLPHDLRRAIATGAVRPYFQPQIELSSGRIVGCEALARWVRDDGSILPPGHFFAAVESGDLWPELTGSMLRSSAAALCHWREAGIEPCKISINLEAGTATDPAFGPMAAATLAEAGAGPELIRFEITEKAAMTDTAAALRALTWLRIKGFELAIDDFGTGFSSLAVLHAMPFSELKIDQSFIRHLIADRDSRIIVKATIDLAHNLDMICVAEGIEDEETWAVLHAMGCDIGQGFLFGPAIAENAFADYLKEGKIKTPWQPSVAAP